MLHPLKQDRKKANKEHAMTRKQRQPIASDAVTATDQPPPPERGEWAALYTAYMIMRKGTERALAQAKVTLPQAIVLVRLDEAEGRPLPVRSLARFLLQESPSVTTLIDRMCERGLVERLQDPRDRRKVLVKMTDKGKETRESIRDLWREIREELFDVFTEEERVEFKALLFKFRRNITRL
jgi:DNA-binding MarR family transcriptional regulator